MLRGVRLREELLTKYVIRNSLKYGRSTTLIIPKCERFTLLVRPLQFLVISALRRRSLGLMEQERSKTLWGSSHSKLRCFFFFNSNPNRQTWGQQWSFIYFTRL